MSSREVYWRDIDWLDVKEVTMHLKGHTYRVAKQFTDFKCFVVFKSSGQEWVNEELTRINTWSVGFVAGASAFVTEAHFSTGKLLKNYVTTAKDIKHLVHASAFK
jgi:hypothetical protein